MANTKSFYRLDSVNSTVIFNCQSKTPALLYFGKRLSEQTTELMLTQLATRQEVKCAVVEEAPISLSPLLGEGFTGPMVTSTTVYVEHCWEQDAANSSVTRRSHTICG